MAGATALAQRFEFFSDPRACGVTSTLQRTKHSDMLLEGLNALRSAKKLFDVSLIVEGRTFEAHRVVLAACSDYFCAMFNDSMREANQKEIKLNGVNARGVELLLDYAYTANLELTRSNVQDVLEVSTHIQMNAVISACSNFLETQIDLENCTAIVTLADFYALENLQKKTYRFLSAHLDEFSKSPDFILLSWEQLQQILRSNYPVDCSEERVLQIVLEFCISKLVDPDVARQLFAQVRFNQIDETYIYHFTDAALANHIHYKPIREVMLRVAQQQKLNGHLEQRSHSPKEIEDETVGEVLTNSRGMELALVKIGGFEPNGLTNQISCYLPSKRKWESLTTIPHIEQCNYGTALLNNNLYVVGGSYDVCLKEYIHPFGFRYCPLKNKWRTIAPIQADRCRFSLNAMGDDFLYAVGGVCELNDSEGIGDQWAHDAGISNCERYNANLDRWEFLPALAENRSQHAGVVLDDRLYVSGGIDRHIVLASLWCFDAVSNQWCKLCPMPTPRADHALIAHNGLIYACGGWYEDPVTETRTLAQTIDVYDMKTDQWGTECRNPMPKYYTGVAAIRRKVYFIGGLLSTSIINRATSAVQSYDLDTKQWTLNAEWEYPNEIWECTCATFYVPRERDELKMY